MTDSINKKKKKYSKWTWPFNVEGTVSEPWPTAKELWEDPKVKQAIEAHNKSVKKKNGS